MLLREPLVHFLLLGLLLLASVRAYASFTDGHTVALDRDAVGRLAQRYTEQYGAPPSDPQLRSLIDDAVREEIYYREGKALGLDQGDEIVRRRIAQKFAFLQQDLAVPTEPIERQLRLWLQANRGRYTMPPRRSFDQRYFAIDHRGDSAARALAEASAQRLAGDRASPPGDDFPGPGVTRLLSETQVDRMFGDARFAAALFAAPIGKWIGPLRSGFGWHVVRVTENAPAQPRRFEDAESDVRADWIAAAKTREDAALYERLRARYRIVVPGLRS